MKLIVITPEHSIADELHMVTDMLAAGLPTLHIRKPDFSPADYRNYIAAIPEEFHERIVIHGAFELINEFKLSGVHLNSAMRMDKERWPQLPASQLSTSFHSWQEIEENAFPFRYVFISPVFDSISKQEHPAAISLTGAKATREKVLQKTDYCPQIIGLGGISAAQINLLHHYGFDGVAVLGSIWTSSDPLSAFHGIMTATDALKH